MYFRIFLYKFHSLGAPIHSILDIYQYSTSNRNFLSIFLFYLVLFLINILHQTATYALYLIHNQ